MTLLLAQIVVVLLVTITCGSIAPRHTIPKSKSRIVGGAQHHWNLILFLFIVGLELDYEHLWSQRTTAAVASGTSILFPFAMAVVLARPLRIGFAPDDTSSTPFVLFVGSSQHFQYWRAYYKSSSCSEQRWAISSIQLCRASSQISTVLQSKMKFLKFDSR